MARRSKGAMGFTPIEQMAVDFFDAIADSDEEKKAFGDVCCEAKALAKSGLFTAADIPQSIMALSEDTPYTRELLTEYFKGR